MRRGKTGMQTMPQIAKLVRRIRHPVSQSVEVEEEQQSQVPSVFSSRHGPLPQRNTFSMQRIPQPRRRDYSRAYARRQPHRRAVGGTIL
jgi:hypothetical protein